MPVAGGFEAGTIGLPWEPKVRSAKMYVVVFMVPATSISMPANADASKSSLLDNDKAICTKPPLFSVETFPCIRWQSLPLYVSRVSLPLENPAHYLVGDQAPFNAKVGFQLPLPRSSIIKSFASTVLVTPRIINMKKFSDELFYSHPVFQTFCVFKFTPVHFIVVFIDHSFNSQATMVSSVARISLVIIKCSSFRFHRCLFCSLAVFRD